MERHHIPKGARRATSSPVGAPPVVLYASWELTPLAHTGGLGDVAAALPVALERKGFNVIRVVPFHRQVARSGITLEPDALRLPVTACSHRRVVGALRARSLQPDTRFIRHGPSFDRPNIYGGPHGDALERYVLFQRAVIGLVRRLRPRRVLLHGNDWHCGLLPFLLRIAPDSDKLASQVKTVFTIHNLAYQGDFPFDDYRQAGLPPEHFTAEEVEHFGNVNCMKAGISLSDAVTTVSPTYAREILRPELGCGLDGELRRHQQKLRGILNGIDTEEWDPSRDPALVERFSADRIGGKRACKRYLLESMRLSRGDPQAPLIGIVTRLVEQKGLDLIDAVLPALLRESDARLVLLGSGEERYEQRVRAWATACPERVGVRIGYDAGFARAIEAGCDLFLMPSRFEPCGLNQLYSLRYGTLPVVHATGGLADTVQDLSRHPRTGNGFTFSAYEPQALLDALHRALKAFRTPAFWQRAVRRAMRQDFSWDRSAEAYASLYRELLER